MRSLFPLNPNFLSECASKAKCFDDFKELQFLVAIFEIHVCASVHHDQSDLVTGNGVDSLYFFPAVSLAPKYDPWNPWQQLFWDRNPV